MIGYHPEFLDGVTLPLPTFSASLSAQLFNQGERVDYPHFSVIMNCAREKRSPAVVCLNIDQNQIKQVGSSSRWNTDDRIGAQHQLDNVYYYDNPWDKGHMARRASAAWGETAREAKHASDETYYYSNASLQHENLNRDEWVGLEDWVKELGLDKDGKITSFSGPIYGDYDRSIHPPGHSLAVIPVGFFKIVCFINKNTDRLDARAFIIYQDIEALADRKGRTRYDNQHYQVTVSEIEDLTGLRFDDAIYEANPAYYTGTNIKPDENVAHFPEGIEVAKPSDMVAAGEKRQTINDDIVDIYITAAMPNPQGADLGNEWVSVLNMGSDTIDVTGWSISDNRDKFLFIDTVVTDPGARVLQPGMSLVIPDIRPLKLNNKGDIIKLYDRDMARIDWVNYTEKMVQPGKPVLFLSPRNTLVA